MDRLKRLARWLAANASWTIATTYGQALVSGVLAGVLGIWGALDDFPGSVIFLMVLVATAASMFILNQAAQILERRRARLGLLGSASSAELLRYQGLPRATIKEAQKHHLKERSVKLTDLVARDRVGTLVVSRRMFDDCYIHGPGVIYPYGAFSMRGCIAVTPAPAVASTAVYTVPLGNAAVGAVIFENCVFRDCLFNNIGFAVEPDYVELMRRAIFEGANVTDPDESASPDAAGEIR